MPFGRRWCSALAVPASQAKTDEVADLFVASCLAGMFIYFNASSERPSSSLAHFATSSLSRHLMLLVRDWSDTD